MTNLPQKTEIQKALLDYCKVKGVSMNNLATQIGVSSATLSKIKNNNWDSIDEPLWLKVWDRVRPLGVAQMFSTTDFETVCKACNQAKQNHFMVGLLADTGMGKTTSLKAYSRAENVYYIYYDSNMRPKHFFAQLGKLLGYDFEGNMYEMVNKACEALNTQKNPVILIDEASKLTDPMLYALHVLRDKTMHNCGIVLAGMPYFKSNLIKKANKQKVGISEFLNRIMIWNELKGLQGKEIEFICSENGITDKHTVARLKTFKRFRDLSNEILLHNTINC